MAETLSAPSAPEIYGTTSATRSTATACGQASLGYQTSTNCTTPPGHVNPNIAWYEASWTTPAAYLIIVYCVTSACVLLLLLCHGYMDCRLNVNFSYAAAEQRELRRRRRHSQRMDTWIEREGRDAGQMEVDTDEEAGTTAEPEWIFEEQRQEQRPTLNAGLDTVQREALRLRQESDARVLVRLQRAGLL